MLATEFFHGQGFGNQLFCYVSVRCIALDLKLPFGTIGQNLFGAPRWNTKGVCFMDIDLGPEVTREDFNTVYSEADIRYFNNSGKHDREIGCNVSLYDANVKNLTDNTIILGNLQSEKYFGHYKAQVKQWLAVKQEYNSYEFCDDNLCVINFRGGEYKGLKELFLTKKYWEHGIKNMRKINPDMKFITITDDLSAARKMLPQFPAYHFDLAKDYVSIKNATYLLLSNSTFSFFPAWTSDTVKFIIAPKYWARHNVSNGYWATGQNIYQGFHYQDRDGTLFNADQCEEEFKLFINRRPDIFI